MNRFEQDISGTTQDEPVAAAPPAAPTNRFQQDITQAAPTPTAPAAPQFNQPFGELKPAEYSWTDTIKNKAQDALMALGASPYSARHIGAGAVDVARLAPPVAALTGGADAAYYSSRGQPLKAGAEAINVIPGAVLGRRMVSGLPQKALAPAEAELGKAADLAYEAHRNSPVRYSPQIMDDVRNEIATTLLKRGNNRADAGKQWAALDEAIRMKTQTGNSNVDFETLRRQLGGGKDRTEIAAGEAAKARLEQYLENVPPQFVRSGTPADLARDRELIKFARGNTAAKFRSETVTNPLNVAELKAERGKDFATTLENKIGALEETKAGQKATRGFTDAESENVRDAITNKLTRRIEGAGDVLTKLGGNPLTGGGVGAGLWHSFGMDPVTAAAAGLGTQGMMLGAGRGLQNIAGSRMAQGVEQAGANLRMRSPLAEMSPRFGFVDDPVVMAKDAAKYLAYPWASKQLKDAIDERGVPFNRR